MIIQSVVINNVFDLVNNPEKIYHSCWGKIVSIEKYNENYIVFYETEPYEDQEWSSVIFANESYEEIKRPLIKEPKYLRSFLIKDKFIHIYIDK